LAGKHHDRNGKTCEAADKGGKGRPCDVCAAVHGPEAGGRSDPPQHLGAGNGEDRLQERGGRVGGPVYGRNVPSDVRRLRKAARLADRQAEAQAKAQAARSASDGAGPRLKIRVDITGAIQNIRQTALGRQPHFCANICQDNCVCADLSLRSTKGHPCRA